MKLPLDVVADVATLGGALTDQHRPYTAQGVSDVVQNLNVNAAKRKEKQ